MAQYSVGLESYAASVAAVGGDWPARVQALRATHSNNETAFRQALERSVLEAHEKAKAGAAQQPQQQYASNGPINTATNGIHQGPSHDAVGAGQQTRSFPGGRSYPGQQQAPSYTATAAPATPGAGTSTPNTPSASNNAPQSSAASSSYIPYARDTAPQHSAGGSSSRTGSSNLRRHQTQASGSHNNIQIPSSGNNNNASSSSSGIGSTLLGRQNANGPPRSSSALNPTAFRQQRVQPIPVTKSREPLPPYFPISTSQAYLTTYPSRVKLGLTSLVQPISSNGQVISANPRAITSTASRAPQAESSNTTTLGKRQRSKVDYTERLRIPEPESSSDEDGSDHEGEEEATQEDTRHSRAVRAAKRSGLPVPLQSHASTPRDSPAPDTKKRKDRTKEDVGGGGRTWLGQDPPGELIQAQPAKRHILPYVPETVLQKKADEKALLVPIRIELDTETHRIRDSFTWNTHENFVTPDIFSRIFCLDLDIPFEPYGLQIAHLIKQQLDEHSGVAEVSLLAPEQEAAGQEADLRVILNLDVQMGTLHLIDRVEWDLTSPLTPEAFAAQMCADLGLGGEAVMLVAHAVHEELLRLKKDCIELGLVGGAGDGTSKGPKKLESIWRDWNEAKAFVPHLEILSPEDIDALEFEKEKNARRLFSRRNYATTSSTVTARDRGGRRR